MKPARIMVPLLLSLRAVSQPCWPADATTPPAPVAQLETTDVPSPMPISDLAAVAEKEDLRLQTARGRTEFEQSRTGGPQWEHVTDPDYRPEDTSRHGPTDNPQFLPDFCAMTPVVSCPRHGVTRLTGRSVTPRTAGNACQKTDCGGGR
jgi:hypothetical protein